MKFHQISKTAEAYIASKSIWKNIYWTLLSIIVWTSFTVRDFWLIGFFLVCLPISWPAGLFEFFKSIKLYVIFFFVLFIYWCLSLQVSCITSSFRGDHKSSLGLLMKPAAISIIWAFVIIILCFCSPNKLTELNSYTGILRPWSSMENSCMFLWLPLTFV